MARLLSVALTEPQVRDRSKTVTRRMGWWKDRHGRRILHVGDRLTLVRKAQGRRNGEPVMRLAEVQVVDVRREPLNTVTQDEVIREGFPGMTLAEFVAFFCEHMRCAPTAEVTRIEWTYLDEAEGQP